MTSSICLYLYSNIPVISVFTIKHEFIYMNTTPISLKSLRSSSRYEDKLKALGLCLPANVPPSKRRRASEVSISTEASSPCDLPEESSLPSVPLPPSRRRHSLPSLPFRPASDYAFVAESPYEAACFDEAQPHLPALDILGDDDGWPLWGGCRWISPPSHGSGFSHGNMGDGRRRYSMSLYEEDSLF